MRKILKISASFLLITLFIGSMGTPLSNTTFIIAALVLYLLWTEGRSNNA